MARKFETNIIVSGTISTISGLATQFLKANGTIDSNNYELFFSKNNAFNKNFGALVGTIAEGNDSRILNGQTAFGWGNHFGLYSPMSGSSNYIQNQNASIQAANMFITGNVGAKNSTSDVINIGTVAGNPNYNFYSATGEWGIRTGTLFDFNIDTYNSGTIKNALKIIKSGAATFISTVTAPTFIGELNGNALTATNSTKWNGLTYSGAYTTFPVSMLGLHANGSTYQFSLTDTRNWLGLGSNAYNSTAYLPLIGGTLTAGTIIITGLEHKYLYINPGNGYEAMVRYNGGTGNSWFVGKRITNSTQADTTGFHFYSEANGDTVVGIDPAGNLRAKADVIAFASSDIRLKDNIKPIENAIQKISKIGGYTFDWNKEQDVYSGNDVGVIAQEIEEILPQLVITRQNGYKAVKYEKLVALLIQGINEQQVQINELKELINTK